jgi:hypothetical protein
MKIKNIRQFRELFAKKRQNENRDIDFIGHHFLDNNEIKFGFFTIPYGSSAPDNEDKIALKNKLQGFLKMADDYQAFYEFFQNAVDAGSSKFIFNTYFENEEHYLVVLNNGKKFSEKDIESILNVGDSSKTSESKIGQYGIGFKLAHKLVGENEGLNELVNESKGPILLSWNNSKIKDFFNDSLLEINDESFSYNNNSIESTDEDSIWLFKFLLTCFPCGIDEKPRLAGGNIADFPPFNIKELDLVKKILLENSLLNDIEEGSCFFLRLGKGKYDLIKIEDHYEKSIKLTLSIFQKIDNQTSNIKQVIINDKELINTNISNYHFSFEFESKNCNIILSFLEIAEDLDYFKGLPNFYKYFPLSKEIHKFKYAIHCDQFNINSPRTELENTNSLFFEELIKNLDTNLNNLWENDRDIFIKLYYALLMSDKKDDARDTITEQYTNKVNAILKKHIPSLDKKIDNSDNRLNVFIKNTEIDFNLSDWNINGEWFFYDRNNIHSNNYSELISQSFNKLGIKEYGIKNILQEARIYDKINVWLNNELDKIILFTSELENIKELTKEEKDKIKANLFNVNFLVFNNQEILSLNDFQAKEENGYFLITDKLETISDILVKLNFKVSIIKLTNILDNFRSYFDNNSQISSYQKLVELFTEKVEDADLEKLTNEEKYKIFEAFRKLNDNVGDRINALKLYKNKMGNYKPFINLMRLPNNIDTIFSIDRQQLVGINAILIDKNQEKKEINSHYENFYFKFWEDILKHFVNIDFVNIPSTLNNLDYAFKHSNWSEKNNNPLSKYKLIIFNNLIIDIDNICLFEENIDDETYKKYQQIVLSYFNIYIPDKTSLLYSKSDLPYGFTSYKGDIFVNENKANNIPQNEIIEIVKLCNQLNLKFFENNCIVFEVNNFSIITNEEKQNYFSNNQAINTIIENYFNEEFIKLPDFLIDFKQNLTINDSKIIEIFYEFYSKDENYLDSEITFSFLPIFLTQNINFQERIFNLIPFVNISIDDEFNINTFFLKLISNLKNHIDISDIHSKLVLYFDVDQFILLKDVPNFIDEIELNNKKIFLDKLLPEQDNTSIEVVTSFYNHFIQNNDTIDRSYLKKVFKISNDVNIKNIVDDFNDCFNGNIINLEQLYFIVENNLFENNEFYIQTITDEFCELKGKFYCNQSNYSKYIHNDYLLNNNISDSFHHYFGEEWVIQKTDIVLSRFHKLNNNFDIEILNKEISIIEKLDFLFDSFNLTSISELNINTDAIKEYLQIEDFFLDNNDINKWFSNDDAKIDFAKKIGFVFEDDNLSKALLFFKGNENVLFNPISIEDFQIILPRLINQTFDIAFENNCLNTFLSYYRKLNLVNLDFYLCYVDVNTVSLEKLKSIPTALNENVLIVNNILEYGNKSELNNLFSSYYMLYCKIQVLFQDVNYLPIEKELIRENHRELETHYYRKWKESVNNLKLYQVDQLFENYKIIIKNDIFNIGDFESSEQHILVEEGNSLFLYFTKNITFYFLSKYYKDIEKYHNQNLHLSLDKLLDIYTDHINILTNSNIFEDKRFHDLIEKDEREKIRKDKIEEINKKDDYSKEWFISYLEILKTYNQNNNNYRRKNIKFKKINAIENVSNFFELSGCLQYVDDNIDETTEVKLLLLYDDKTKKEISVTNLSKKHQNVAFQYNINEFNIFENVFEVELSFTPVINLLDRLHKAFNSLIDWNDINEAFPAINYIYGPPGTGKTTNVVDKIINICNENNYSKIIVLTPTNKAADVVAEKLYQNNFQSFIRISGPTSQNIPDEYYQNQINEGLINSTNVFITTIHRFSYLKVDFNESETYLNNLDWDYMFIDEASMINLPYITFSSVCYGQKSDNPILYISGDPNQIPPIPEVTDSELEENDIKTENIYDMFGLKSFDAIIQRNEKREIDNVENLTIQYRSVSDIGNLFSNFKYNDQVVSYRNNEPNVKIDFFGKLFQNPISFVDLPLDSENPIFKVHKLYYSSYHIYACLFILEIINYLDKNKEKIKINNNTDSKIKIGIISPYKAQSALFNRIVAEYNITSSFEIIADTVHSFQGDDCDIVFFVVNPSNDKYIHPLSLLAKDYIYNVAISRAKDYLIIINPYEKIKNNIHINRLSQIHNQLTKENISIISSNYIEKIIFNDVQSDYIDSNTLITSHDDVNVFNKNNWKYFIKKSESAIDIQIGK